MISKRNTTSKVLLAFLICLGLISYSCTDNNSCKSLIRTDKQRFSSKEPIQVSNNSCKSIISTEKQRFSGKEPIQVSYSIENISRDTIKIWHCGFWCNNKIIVTDSTNAEVPLTQIGKHTRSLFSPGGVRFKNFPWILAPYQIDSAYEKQDLKTYFVFENPGIYYVKYFYNEVHGESTIKVESNVLEILIEN